MTVLFGYQQEGAAFLSSRRAALLADEQGLGKTAQAIAALKSLSVSYFLVICPASVVENWKREIARFWPGNNSWNVISFDRYARDHGRVDWLGTGGSLVIDEAHFCKSRDAKRTKSILGKGGLAERARHVLALTATPTPNHNGELWPLLAALAPETIISKKTGKPLPYWSFVNRFCRTRDNGFGIQIEGNKNTDELRQRIAPFVLRRRKDEVLKELPPIRFDTLPLSSAAAVAAIRKLDCDGEIAKVEAALREGPEALAKLAPHVATLRRVTGLAKAPLVAEWVNDWLNGGGEKIVIFAHHRDVIDCLRTEIRLPRISICLVTGSMSLGMRQQEVDDFQNNLGQGVFIGQIQAAGTGITLTAASDVLFAESSWVPAENQQAAMRVHRIGQKNACLVRFATLAGSIDEQIQRVVARKTQDISALFD